MSCHFRKAFCEYCHDRIWGLGKQGYKCTSCRILLHKKCHKFTQTKCDADLRPLTRLGSDNGSRSSASGLDEEIGVNVEGSPYNGKGNLIPIIGKSGLAPNKKFCIEEGIKCNNGPPKKHSIRKELLDIVTANKKSVSVDDFNLICVIGRGNFAKVLMVELKSKKQLYAMKVMKKQFILEDEDIEWVQIEKNVFEMASNHPFLVGLHSCFQTASRLFFVIELVQGGDLMYHMQRRKRLQEDHAQFYSAEIALALNFLHGKGIIFRDLKLDNVLLAHDGHIKLTDYGMCKQGIKFGEKASTFCGTPNYMAPEILNNEAYSFSVDWWALGILLFEMMVGRSPFNTDDLEERSEEYLFQTILTKEIKPPQNLSHKARKVILDFLNKDPIQRLGCHTEHGFQEIVDHFFFRSIDWKALKLKQIKPPHVPKLHYAQDFDNFPNEYTAEPTEFTPVEKSAVDKIDQSEFRGFSYVNPLLTSSQDEA